MVHWKSGQGWDPDTYVIGNTKASSLKSKRKSVQRTGNMSIGPKAGKKAGPVGGIERKPLSLQELVMR